MKNAWNHVLGTVEAFVAREQLKRVAKFQNGNACSCAAVLRHDRSATLSRRLPVSVQAVLLSSLKDERNTVSKP